MAMQTALRRAQAQDEAMLRNVSNPDELMRISERSPPLIPAMERSLDGDSSASSQNSNPLPVTRRMSSATVVPATTTTSIGTVSDSHNTYTQEYRAHQSADLLEDCQKLLERFKYPWEMMPLMYAILKDAKGNLEEASRRIDEGRAAEILLELCQRLKDKFQLPWKMISLVYVILKDSRENQDEAWRHIEEAFLEFRTLAAVEAARYSYHHIPYTGFYSTAAAAALYPPVYLPSMSIYHHPSTALLSSAPNSRSPTSPTSHSPLAASTPIRPGSRT